jgi:hypothetical protein
MSRIVRRPISNQQPPIANLEHPYRFSNIIRYVNEFIRNTTNAHNHPIDRANCLRMFQSADRRWLIAELRTLTQSAV